jgi:L-seryl-tRNA(Ser) seleniumtransferase
MTGFVEAPSRRDLVDLARRRGLTLVEDLGSGALLDLAGIGVSPEPRPQEAIAEGVDVVTFSGDKLLGGPQAGLVVGKRAPVKRMKSNPLARALRLDKMTLAALEETLRLYLEPEKLPGRIPTLALLATPAEELERRARRAAAAISAALGASLGGQFEVSVAKTTSQVGGGSLPLADIETFAVVVTSSRFSPNGIVATLRKCEIPIIARIGDDKVYIDFRTIQARDDDLLIDEIVGAFEDPAARTGSAAPAPGEQAERS